MARTNIHDGHRVERRCKELKIAGKEFAKEMAWTPSKTYRMFSTESWLTEDLEKAGKILGCDFFAAYSDNAPQPQPKLVQGVLVSLEVLRSEAARKRALEELEQQEDDQ